VTRGVAGALAALCLFPQMSFAHSFGKSFQNHVDAVRAVLDGGGPVRLAIAVESVSDEARLKALDRDGYAAWAQNRESALVSEAIGALFDALAGEKLFSILERRSVRKILDEFDFQLKGYTRPVDAEKIGQFLNANYMLVVSESGEAVYARLVAVQEAQVLSVSSSAEEKQRPAAKRPAQKSSAKTPDEWVED
jgi:hypothetical protein